MTTKTSRRLPAEWEEHRATWLAWPHEVTDWPGKLAAVSWVYPEIIRLLAENEQVELLCHTRELLEYAKSCLTLNGVRTSNVRLHYLPTDRSWLRDSAPIMVKREDGSPEWVRFAFNAWAKYENFAQDTLVPEHISRISEVTLTDALRPDNREELVLEGGAIECDGEGTLLVTEECLLSNIQERNPGLNRETYEEAFAEYLGIEKTIWLGQGIVGDDTHGHIDDIARFVAPGKVVVAYEENPNDENHFPLLENIQRLEKARDAKGRVLDVVSLPMPRPIYFGEERLPASYLNFYIANGLVLAPTFNDEKDFEALSTLRELFPAHKVVGIHCLDFVLGQGTLHCATQQQYR